MMRGPKDATRGRSLLPALLWMAAVPAMAAAPRPAAQQTTVLPTVVVTATRAPQRAFDVPASVNAVLLDAIGSDRPGVNVSESLREVPGVMARDRQNYAQDEQVSIRGFGARSTFGVRGVRLYVDGVGVRVAVRRTCGGVTSQRNSARYEARFAGSFAFADWR